MSISDPESMGLAAKVIGALIAVATPITWIWARLDKKADKHTVNGAFHEVKLEQAVHRGYFKDVFNKLEEHAKRDEDHFERIERAAEERHRELLMHLVKRGDS